jgi:hypothetical protein
VYQQQSDDIRSRVNRNLYAHEERTEADNNNQKGTVGLYDRINGTVIVIAFAIYADSH